ncbi:hypothetical protein [Amycolatopsis sp. lyj-346]|uniref:hypothetical protein n=1 Tax=Amycolatopsis sp. lyj-346 TaxID=2789289 RepID=UPI0039782974
MSAARVALVVTCGLAAALTTWFAIARWDDVNKIATMTSALGALAAVGIAVWAAVRTPPAAKSATVSDTGPARADTGGKATTGISGKANVLDARICVERTGRAEASGGGDAVTGIQLD